MATISSAGIGSGLDVNSIVSQLVALEKVPLQSLQVKADTAKAQISAMGDISSQFSALSDTATRLSSADAWSARTSSSSNTSAATITTTNTTPAQTFTLDVDALAQQQSATSTALASGALVGEGTLTIHLGTWSNTGTGATAAATLAAANTALTNAQNNLTAATTDKASKDAAQAAADQAVLDANAAAAGPLADQANAQAAFASADAIYQPLLADQQAKQAAYTTAQTAFGNAGTAATNAANALTAADAGLATATATSANANATLASAVTALSNASTVSQAANNALSIADNGLASANTSLVNKNNQLTTANSASTTALATRDSALQSDQDAKAALNAFVSSDPGALADPNAAAYASAYADLVDTVAAAAANADGTGVYQQSDQDAIATKKVELTNARALLTSSVRSAANVVTAAADSKDASSLIAPALKAQAAAAAAAAAVTAATNDVSTATTNRATAYTDANTASAALVSAQDDHANAYAAASSATAALNTATANQSAAAAAKSLADTALATATTTRDNAQTALNQANADLVQPSSDRDAAQATLDAANAALASPNSDRTTALNNQALATSAAAAATTAFNSATAAVAAANAQVAAATGALGAASPVFTPSATSSDVSVVATATDTLSTLATKINAANAGVTASVFSDGTNQRLVLTSSATGQAAGFRVQVSDTGDSNNTDDSGLSRFGFDPQSAVFGLSNSGVTTQYAQDAKVRINGIAATSSTNTFANNIPGVTINVQATTTTGYGTGSEVKSPVTMAVKEDVTGAVKNINDFVTAYNAIAKTLGDDTKYDATTKTSSIFQGDSAVVGLQRMLRSILSSVSTGSAYQHLSDVGVEQQLDGSLSINTAKLSAAANNGTELQKFFTLNNGNASTNGFSLKFAAFSQGVLASNGAVTNKTNALNATLTRNAADQTKINDRATTVEAQLRKTYSALDGQMASLSALSAYVSQQVTTWNKSTG